MLGLVCPVCGTAVVIPAEDITRCEAAVVQCSPSKLPTTSSCSHNKKKGGNILESIVIMDL